jgi:hypothetical protein
MKTSQTVFHVLDLDRTLFDTAKLAQRLKEIIAWRNTKLADDINAQIKQHAASKTSFFIFEYIAHQIGHDMLNEYVNELSYIAPAKELLLPGATERIAFAKSQPGWSMGIFTYGSKRDQMIKLRLAGLQMERYIITDTPKKGDILASWKQPNGKYRLPIEFGGHLVDTLTLDDDKLVAFENLPDDVFGQWITKASLGGSTELKKFSNNVRVVRDLKESIEYLKNRLY